MIAHLNGKIAAKKAPWVVLDVHGVGYEVQVPMGVYFALPEPQQPIQLLIHYVVREEGHAMYGFMAALERDLFRAMIKVSGVGPKVALSVLSTMSAQDFISHIRNENSSLLTQVPGIGKKTAERLVIEMRDRIKQFETAEPAATSGSAQAQGEALEALISLGFSAKEAKTAIQRVPHAEHCEAILRDALQGLAK